MVVTSKISFYPFSPEHKRKLDSIEQGKDWEGDMGPIIEQFISEGQLTADLHARLLAGTNEQPSAKNSEKRALSPMAIAKFLASIAQCSKASLPREVKNGLRSLGIESPKVGRPRGKKTASKYARYVEALREVIEKTGVFSTRAKTKEKRGGKWRTRFTQFLQEQGWPADSILLLLTSQTPRNLAMHIAADIFECEYEVVYRACRRTAESVQK